MRQNALRSSIKSLNAENVVIRCVETKHRAHIDQMPGRMSIDKTAHGNPPIIANDRMRPTYTLCSYEGNGRNEGASKAIWLRRYLSSALNYLYLQFRVPIENSENSRISKPLPSQCSRSLVHGGVQFLTDSAEDNFSPPSTNLTWQFTLNDLFLNDHEINISNLVVEFIKIEQKTTALSIFK